MYFVAKTARFISYLYTNGTSALRGRFRCVQPIFHRLLMAASNVEMRQDMNVEDECYSIIKEQEGKVYGLERDLAEKQEQLNEKQEQLRTLVRMLVQSGQAIESIADSLQLDMSSVKALL